MFLQDGKNDQNIYAGNWYLANQDMASALEYAGYDTSSWSARRATTASTGRDSAGRAALAVARLPEADHDGVEDLGAARSRLILDPGKEWELVSQGTSSLRVRRSIATEMSSSRISRTTESIKSPWMARSPFSKKIRGGANGLMFGPDGRLYACQNGRKRIVAYDKDGKETVIAEGVNSTTSR